MINLWYEDSYWGNRTSGPQKVVQNTIEALTQEEIPFSVNSDIYKYNILLQYQHEVAHKKHENLEHDTCLIGPQFWPFDHYGKFLIDNQHYFKKVIAPSEWVKNLFVTKCGLLENKVSVWSAGIKVPQIEHKNTIDCLIYHKNRSESDLIESINFLQQKNLTFETIQYGSYTQNDFRNLLSKVKFCFIIDGTESQGIAIQEMMAYNKPLFVWDVREWNHMGDQYTVPASSVPYWTDNCGKRFFDLSGMKDSFDEFYDNINFYNSKKIIEDELSYSQSIKKLIQIFEE